MYILKKITVSVLLSAGFISVVAQYADSTGIALIKKIPATEIKKGISVKSLIVPGILIAYGFSTLGNESLKNVNFEFQEDIWSDKPHKTKHIDNYLMFTPAVSVYGLNALGLKGQHNVKDQTMIFLLSSVIQNATVFSLKKITHQMRPDSSGFTSFPSGHTATAFASAEFLYQEYKKVSLWYGIAGYSIAAATGYLRLYNNKHWFSDVLAGAGIGILSTKLAYWIYPSIKKWIFKDKTSKTLITPFYQNNIGGILLVHNFHF